MYNPKHYFSLNLEIIYIAFLFSCTSPPRFCGCESLRILREENGIKEMGISYMENKE